jgi:RHS repeat-associated protein
LLEIEILKEMLNFLMIRIAEPLPQDDRPYESRGRFDAELHTERWYDPTVGRWLTEDVVGFADGCNLYCYVGNPPVQPAASDPSQL